MKAFAFYLTSIVSLFFNIGAILYILYGDTQSYGIFNVIFSAGAGFVMGLFSILFFFSRRKFLGVIGYGLFSITFLCMMLPFVVYSISLVF